MNKVWILKPTNEHKSLDVSKCNIFGKLVFFIFCVIIMRVVIVNIHFEIIFCKHQVVIILETTEVDQDHIVKYCGTDHKIFHDGLITMF